MINYPTNPLRFQFNPWTDPNGAKWLYIPQTNKWARFKNDALTLSELILISPNGTCWQISVNDNGQLTATEEV